MRSNDERAQHPARQPRKPEVDLRLTLVTGGPILPWRPNSSATRNELQASDVLRAANAVSGRPGAFLVAGGDPLRRRDARELLTELVRLRPGNLGVYTSGEGVTAAVAQRVRSIGVQRLHIPFHCARQDAHDWLVGRAGALKTAHRAIRACIDAELPVTADIVLTRPTVPHLAETVEVLARLGVRAICVRRLTAGDAEGPDFVPLSPRLELLGDSLEQAASAALQRRVRLTLRDMPLCAAPRLRPLFAAPNSEVWVMPDGAIKTRSEVGEGCATCPGSPQCAGAPPDYVARFGWEELIDARAIAGRLHESVEDQQAVRTSEPMVFTWRGPHRVRCEACAEIAEERTKTPQPHESTRAVRARLVQAARFRPAVLRLVGADLLAHPQAALLIYDAVRLFPRVELAGEVSAVVDWSDLDLRRAKDLARIDVALYGPDAPSHDAHCGIPGAFSAMQRAVESLRKQAKVPIGAYAILHDARAVPAFADAWSRGELPGEPRFRLSARGSSLDELVQCARALPAGAARAALLAVLPQCLCEQEGLTDAGGGTSRSDCAPQQSVQYGRSVPYRPRGSDPIGAFETCREDAEACATPGCPGTAVGWQSSVRSKRWTVNI